LIFSAYLRRTVTLLALAVSACTASPGPAKATQPNVEAARIAAFRAELKHGLSAENHFRENGNAFSYDSEVANDLGAFLFRKAQNGLYDQAHLEAISVLGTATSLAPNNAMMHLNYAIALNEQQRSDEALAQLRIAARLAPNDFLIRYALAEVLANAVATGPLISLPDPPASRSEGAQVAMHTYRNFTDRLAVRETYHDYQRLLPSSNVKDKARAAIEGFLHAARLRRSDKVAKYDACTLSNLVSQRHNICKQ